MAVLSLLIAACSDGSDAWDGPSCAARAWSARIRLAERPPTDGGVIAEALSATCLPDWLEVDDTGRVRCRVVETLPSDGELTSCDALEGREVAGAQPIEPETGNARCLVDQVVPDRDSGSASGSPGWYFDDSSEQAGAMCGENGRTYRYSSGADPPPGTEIAIRCVQLRPRVAPPDAEAGRCDGV